MPTHWHFDPDPSLEALTPCGLRTGDLTSYTSDWSRVTCPECLANPPADRSDYRRWSEGASAPASPAMPEVAMAAVKAADAVASVMSEELGSVGLKLYQWFRDNDVTAQDLDDADLELLSGYLQLVGHAVKNVQAARKAVVLLDTLQEAYRS